jgi:transposase
MLRERTGQHLEQWLTEAQENGLPEFEPFITGVQKDKDAVLAGLTLPWSNGPLEGHVNRLKLIKRSMYGRAEFDLLKRRVLHQNKKNQERKDKRKSHQGRSVDRLMKSKRMKNSTNSQHTTPLISKVA